MLATIPRISLVALLTACAPAAPPAGTGAGTKAAAGGGAIGEQLCAAVPAGATPEATLAALAEVPGVKADPDLVEMIDTANVAGCMRLPLIEKFLETKTGSKWSCPAAKANLECDPKADLAWMCDQARDFMRGAPQLTEQDHSNFSFDVALGLKARPPGTIPQEDPRGKLYTIDKRKPEHDFNPDFNLGPKSGCEILEAANARARAIGLTDWSCPELTPALGCKTDG